VLCCALPLLHVCLLVCLRNKVLMQEPTFSCTHFPAPAASVVVFPAVALAFHEQLVGSALPMAQHDRHVDVLATPEGLMLCSERARFHSSSRSSTAAQPQEAA
jgi:hypothetical protein